MKLFQGSQQFDELVKSSNSGKTLPNNIEKRSDKSYNQQNNFPNLENSILIIGLGNPGPKYIYTRHNVGFLALDSIASYYNFPIFSNNSKFSADLSQGLIESYKTFIAKPNTFMNLSGQAVQKIKAFYKIDLNHIIVIHDDIDLDFGKVKVKIGGGHGGHNGLKSIDEHIGKDYIRVRLGIGRPLDKDDVSNYVLDNFSKHEMQHVKALVTKLATNINYIFTGQADQFIRNVS